MKKQLLVISLLAMPCVMFGQKSLVKEAGKLAKSSNFTEAVATINKALTSDETKASAYAWDTAGDIQRAINEKENEKAYIRKPYDTTALYNSLLQMYNYYLQCDEFEQIPNKKGKVKFKYRKKNAEVLAIERNNLINGGVNFQNDTKKAFEFFAMYIDIASAPMMKDKNLSVTDTISTEIAYYAAMMASRNKDLDNVIKYAKYAAIDKKNGATAFQFMCEAYKAKKDTASWVLNLKEGIKNYPTQNSYFFANLVDYYTNTGKLAEAMDFADNMLAKDPSNAFNVYVKAFLFMNMKDFDNAIKFYQKALELNPEYAEAYINLGWIYCQKALNYSNENATSDINDPKFAADKKVVQGFYKEALPYYEKVKTLKPDNKELWLNALYTIYYNLNMGDKLKEIEALMN